jgi:hypothetical protein
MKAGDSKVFTLLVQKWRYTGLSEKVDERLHDITRSSGIEAFCDSGLVNTSVARFPHCSVIFTPLARGNPAVCGSAASLWRGIYPINDTASALGLTDLCAQLYAGNCYICWLDRP